MVRGIMDRPTNGRRDRSSTIDLLVDLDVRRGRQRRSLRESLRAAIQDGRLTAGSRLPASRTLADGLGLSRGVVTDTYDQLALEGYLEIRPRSAPVVATVRQQEVCAPEPVAPSWRYDFIPTTPDISLFPRSSWRRALDAALRDAPDLALDYGDHRGRIELREALASYLGRVRGVRVEPARMVITQGFSQALDLLCRTLAHRGARTIAVENPSLDHLWATVGSSGLRLVGVPMDDDGPRLDVLRRLRPDAFVVSPAHQYPTGQVMAPDRRAALIAWACEQDRVIIEDDYDAENRYDRLPVGALQGLDPEHVIHAGTASKVLAPGLRLGWLSLPAGLVEPVVAYKHIADSGSPTIDQLALAHLIDRGDYERQVAHARHEYRARRDRLVIALARELPEREPRGVAAGVHVLLPLPDDADDVAISAAAEARSISVRALSPSYLPGAERGTTPARGLLLGYARLPVTRIDEAVAALADVVRAATRIDRPAA
jgi:GntR family transcriptional regulator / MocR family aminotransferase